MRSPLQVRVLAVAMVVSVTGCRLLERSTPPARELTPVSLRLKWMDQAQFAGVYVAQDRGLYADAGIDCTTHPGGQDFNAVKLVAAGSDDFGIWDADQVLIARSRGVPVKAVAVCFQISPVCFFVRRDSNIHDPHDFVGKTVAMQYGTNVRTEYLAMMRHAGVDPSRVVETPSRYDLQRFLTGEVPIWNGYTINEPLVAEEHGVPVRLICPRDYGVDMYADCLIVADRTIEQRPQLVRGVVRATLEGWAEALSHRDIAVDAVLKRDPRLKRSHERAMLAAAAKLVTGRGVDRDGLGSMSREVWASMFEELRSQDLLGEQPFALDDVYTTAYLPEQPIIVAEGDGQ